MMSVFGSFIAGLALVWVLVAVACSGQDLAQRGDRMVGQSSRVEPGEFPFIARVQTFSSQTKSWSNRCGGSLIEDQYVLTAALCVTNRLHIYQPREIRVKLGCHDRRRCQPDYEVAKVMVNHQFDGANNDVAILKLKRRADTSGRSRHIDIIHLEAAKPNDETWDNLTFVGWDDNDDSFLTPLKAQTRGIPYDECKKKYSNIGPNEMCAGTPGTDFCTGDEGGPLFRRRPDGTHAQVGIISSGDCGLDQFGSVYARVASFWRWIIQCVNSNHCSTFQQVK